MIDRPLSAVSVAEAATNRLRESLFAGDFAAGDEIRDTRVAAEYRIARPTARIAVQHLISEGVLVRPSGSSARVRAFDPDEVRDLYRVRRLIELDAVREIVRDGLPLGRVQGALETFAALATGSDRPDWARYASADITFHSAVVETSSSPRLKSTFWGLGSEIRLLMALLRTEYPDGAALFAEHEDLFALLSAPAPLHRIEAAWSEHFDSAVDSLVRRMAAGASSREAGHPF